MLWKICWVSTVQIQQKYATISVNTQTISGSQRDAEVSIFSIRNGELRVLKNQMIDR